MANQISLKIREQIEIRQQMLELGQQIDNLNQGIANNPEALSDHLAQAVSIQTSLTSIEERAKQIDEVGQDIIGGLEVFDEQVDTLFSSLRNRVNERFPESVTFDQKMRAIIQDAKNMLANRGEASLHKAADQIESTLKGRIQDLRNNATPEQNNIINGFLAETEGLHCQYFEEEFQKILASFTAENFANFNAIIPLIINLHEFVSKRPISQENNVRMAALYNHLFFLLNDLIKLQQTAEQDPSGQPLPALESVAKEMQQKLENLIAFLATINAPAPQKEEGQPDVDIEDAELKAALALSEQQPEATEPVSDTDEDLALAAALELSEQQPQSTEPVSNTVEEDLDLAAALELSEQQPQSTEPVSDADEDLALALALQQSIQPEQPASDAEDDLALALELSRLEA